MFKWLLESSLQNRLVVLAAGVVLLAYGAFTLSRTPVDVFPDLNKPTVTLMTEAGGMAAEEVEQLITFPLETAMNGLPGVEAVRSVSSAGLSFVYVTFGWTTDVYRARQMVSERLSAMEGTIPDGIVPRMGPVSSIMGEILQIAIPVDVARISPMAVREYADWVLRPRLMAIPGVAQVIPIGGEVRQFQVQPDTARMAELGISMEQLDASLRGYSSNTSGGFLELNGREYLIRNLGRSSRLDDLRNLALTARNGQAILLRQIANVEFAPAIRRGDAGFEGQPAVILGIQKQPTADTLALTRTIETALGELKNSLPTGMETPRVTFRQASFIEASIDTLKGKLIGASVCVAIVLFVFLGTLRPTVIALTAIPISIFVTALVFRYFGLSINTMTLGGLAIAIGIMVDGSVVVVENTFARLGQRADEGVSRLRIILDSATEVGKPVLFGVGIIILVFMPLLSLEGMEGKMFAPLALTIAIALALSLILSFTLSPVLCSYILKGGADHDTPFVARIKAPYLKALSWSISNPQRVIFYAGIALLFSFLVFPLLGKSFIPIMKEGAITPVIVRQANISLDESVKMEFEAMKRIAAIPGVKSAVSRLGRGESPADPGQPNESDPIVSLKPSGQRKLSQTEIEDRVRDALKALPGVETAISQPIAARVDEMVSGVRSQVAVKIFGDDIQELRKLGSQIGRVLANMEGATDLRIEQVTGQNYLTLNIDREAIARYGLNVEDVNNVIEIANGGREATQIYEGERRFPLVLRYPKVYRETPEAFENIILKAPGGALIPLKDIAHVELVDGPSQISREAGKRRLVVGVNVQDRDLGGFVNEAQKRIAHQLTIPQGYTLDWGGQFENMQRAMARLMIIIPLTIAAIFFLLFILFNSLRMASLIILVLPFASIGGIFGLLLSGEYLSVPAAVGFINLWGIAVLNGVVLVSFIRQLRDEGWSTREAVFEGCEHRFRPVMMTASVALLALIPMLFSSGPGSEVTRPLAVVVISGLLSSTALTLLVLPVLYPYFEEKSVEA